jgi:hypothetical protein
LPATKKESVCFGIMMCFGMVFVMTFYNLLLIGKREIPFKDVFFEFIIGFAIALLLDLFIVGPGAKKVALKLPIDKSKKLSIIIAISTCMVVGMAFFMSFFGMALTYMHNGLTGSSFLINYLAIFIKNFLVAYPLQLIIIGPLVRFLFIKFVSKNQIVKAT